MAKSITEMAAEIAAAQAGHATMSAEETEALLERTFKVLHRMKSVEGGESVEVGAEREAPELKAVDPKKSIQRNKVSCLECGKEFKQLTATHLKSHGLTPKEYRKKHGFSAKQALAAKNLSAQRRKRAKELGLGERLAKAAKRRAKKA